MSASHPMGRGCAKKTGQRKKFGVPPGFGAQTWRGGCLRGTACFSLGLGWVGASGADPGAVPKPRQTHGTGSAARCSPLLAAAGGAPVPSASGLCVLGSKATAFWGVGENPNLRPPLEILGCYSQPGWVRHGWGCGGDGSPKKTGGAPRGAPRSSSGAAARAAHPAPRPRFVGFWPGQPGREAAWGQGPSCGPCPGPRAPCVGSGPCKQAKGHLGPPRPGRIRPRAARGQRLGRKELGRERSEGRGRAPSGQPIAWKGHGGESGYGDKGLARFGQRWGRNPNGEAPSEGSPLRPLRCRHPKDPTEAPGTTPVWPGARGRAPWGQKTPMGPPSPPQHPNPCPVVGQQAEQSHRHRCPRAPALTCCPRHRRSAPCPRFGGCPWRTVPARGTATHAYMLLAYFFCCFVIFFFFLPVLLLAAGSGSCAARGESCQRCLPASPQVLALCRPHQGHPAAGQPSAPARGCPPGDKGLVKRGALPYRHGPAEPAPPSPFPATRSVAGSRIVLVPSSPLSPGGRGTGRWVAAPLAAG